MRIAVDIDGVVGDQVPHVLKRINRKLRSSYSKSDIRSWNERLAETDIETEIEEALLDEEYVLTMPVYRGARGALRVMREGGYYIILATGRPPTSHGATEKWLQKREVPYDEVVNTRETGKRVVAADILVDDNVLNVIDFAHSGRRAILFLQPWNDRERPDDERIYRARGWQAVCSLLAQIRREASL